MNNSVDKCALCNNEPKFIALVESDENPQRSETMWLCEEHMGTLDKAIIDSWTKQEWLADE